MLFDKALQEACAELQLDQHTKTINYDEDASTYAEQIVSNFKEKPFVVKSSFLFLDGVDFCFYQDGDNVDFTISGRISGNDKSNIAASIKRALQLCALCESKMKKAKNTPKERVYEV